jgi:hypothetical protein
VHDRIAARRHTGPEHDLGGPLVDPLDVRPAGAVEREDGRGVHERVAARDRRDHGVRVGGVADGHPHPVGQIGPVLAQRGSHPPGVARQQPHVVTGLHQRGDGRRTDEAGAARDENLHPGALRVLPCWGQHGPVLTRVVPSVVPRPGSGSAASRRRRPEYARARDRAAAPSVAVLT